MKKIQILALILLTTFMVHAQYKKASFFSKGGRTYEFGTTAHLMGDGKAAPLGFYFGWGRDKTESHFFRWTELVVLPPYKYRYQTMASNSSNGGAKESVWVSGKSSTHMVYNFNVGYHLLDRSEDEKKILPFVFLGFNVVLAGSIKEQNYTSGYYDLEKETAGSEFSLGVRGGAGVLFNLTEKTAIKLAAGYNHQFNFDVDNYGTSTYDIFTSHPLVSLGIRFRLLEE